jgi:hypothetical protein
MRIHLDEMSPMLRCELSTGCRLKVSDFHQDGEEATIRLHEKGDKRRTIGTALRGGSGHH